MLGHRVSLHPCWGGAWWGGGTEVNVVICFCVFMCFHPLNVLLWPQYVYFSSFCFSITAVQSIVVCSLLYYGLH